MVLVFIMQTVLQTVVPVFLIIRLSETVDYVINRWPSICIQFLFIFHTKYMVAHNQLLLKRQLPWCITPNKTYKPNARQINSKA